MLAHDLQGTKAVLKILRCELNNPKTNSSFYKKIISSHDYKTLFNVEVQLGLNKANRLIFGDSLMTHAMVFTGYGTDGEDKPTKFRVENSWGESRGGEKGKFFYKYVKIFE